MDDEQARRFWERALREIRDDGFFAPVQTAERPPTVRVPRVRGRRLRLTNLQLVMLAVALALLTTFLVIVLLAPAFI